MDTLTSLSGQDQSPVRSFGFRLWHVKHAWTRRVDAALVPTGLTHMQFILLRAADYLARQGERPAQARLADYLGTDRMMVSKVLRLLDGKGLVVRVVHPDDVRAFHVVLTEAGRRSLAGAIDAVIAEQARFFGTLGAERERQLGSILDELLDLHGSPLVRRPVVTATTDTEGS